MHWSSYILPTAMALVFHGLVVAALLVNWEGEYELEITEVEPYFIEASVVPENPHRVREQRAAAAAATARQRAAEAEAARTRARQEAAEQERINREQARIDVERLAAEQKARDEAERRAREQAEAEQAAAAAEAEAEALRNSMESELARAVQNEQLARRAVTDDEKAMAYASQIQQEIIRNWSRPPSARNGMQALLKVNLVPTGEVVDVAIMSSSGNDAFDRSAILAVEKAERFIVPDDSRLFERSFRQFEVLFRPEDLRL